MAGQGIQAAGRGGTTSEPAAGGGLKRSVTLVQALGITFHQIVGGGILILIGIAALYTGGGVPIALLVAAAAVLVSAMPYAAMSAAMPVTGGTYTYAARLLHPGLGFLNLAVVVLGQTSISVYGLGAGEYLKAIFPAINPTLVALVLIAVFYLANLVGASVSARAGVVLAVVMIVAFGIFIATGFAHVEAANYPPMFTHGFSGLFQASALLTFALGGGVFIAEMGNEVQRPERTIPLAIIGGTVFAALLYVLIAIPALGVLPFAQVAGHSLSNVAAAIMPHWLFQLFVLGGVTLGLMGAMNASMTWGTKSVLAAVEDGWLPARLAVVNKRFGTPHVLLTVIALIGAAPAVFGISISDIASGGSALLLLAFIPLSIASLRLRAVRPELVRKAPFRLPYGIHLALVVLAVPVLAFQSYLLLSKLSSHAAIPLAVWMGAALLWVIIRYRAVRARTRAKAIR